MLPLLHPVQPCLLIPWKGGPFIHLKERKVLLPKLVNRKWDALNMKCLLGKAEGGGRRWIPRTTERQMGHHLCVTSAAVSSVVLLMHWSGGSF